MYMTTSSSGGGVGPHRYHDDGDAEMFDDEHEVADAVFPFDLVRPAGLWGHRQGMHRNPPRKWAHALAHVAAVRGGSW